MSLFRQTSAIIYKDSRNLLREYELRSKLVLIFYLISIFKVAFSFFLAGKDMLRDILDTSRILISHSRLVSAFMSYVVIDLHLPTYKALRREKKSTEEGKIMSKVKFYFNDFFLSPSWYTIIYKKRFCCFLWLRDSLLKFYNRNECKKYSIILATF